MDEVGEHTLEVMRLANWYNTYLFSFLGESISGEILEIGVGIGNFTSLLVKKGTVTAIDINADYLTDLKEKFVKRVDIGFGDIEQNKLFFKNKKFDTVICLNVLEHIKDHKRALTNIYRLLKPGGRLVLLVPAHQMLFSELDRGLGHFRRYSISQIRKLTSDVGFSTKDIRYFNWFSAVGWFVFLKLTGWRKMPVKEVGIFNSIGKFLLWPEKFIKFPFGLSVITVVTK